MGGLVVPRRNVDARVALREPVRLERETCKPRVDISDIHRVEILCQGSRI